MKIFALTTLVMIAFAGNSILTRLALANNEMTAFDFALIRVASGAALLALLVLFRNWRSWPRGASTLAIIALSVYLLGFSLAYITIDTGTGALILFAGVQITMFLGALLSGERPARNRWIGAGIAFLGLCALFLPGAAAPGAKGAGLMALAAVGWGVYSLIGRKADDPLLATAWNFVLSVPVVFLAWWLTGGVLYATTTGIWLAIASGAVTSGLGYALWYAVLPRIDASLGAIAQLSVPIIAAIGGLIVLGEPLTLTFALAAVLVLGGIMWSIRA